MINEKNNEPEGNRKLQVLIVDDDFQDYELISEMIGSHPSSDFQFHWAKDSEEAKATLAGSCLDIVAVDYNLGSESGLVVLKMLSDLYSDIPYILITGMEDPDLYKLGLAAGASDFVVKDDDARLFEKTFQYAVQNKRIQNNLKAANESKNRLMTLLADELELPLSEFVKTVSVLKNGSERLTKYEVKDFLTEAYRSSNEALAAIYSVIDWGNSQTEAMKPYFAMTNLKDLVSSVFNLLTFDAQRKKIELRCPRDFETSVYTDSKMLSVVIRKLVSAAIDFAQIGDAVELRAKASGAGMKISVRNRGYVIPQAQISKLRLGVSEDTSADKTEQVSHNKLDACRHLLELLGANLHIDSSSNAGTTFEFELPIDPTREVQEDRISPMDFSIPY